MNYSFNQKLYYMFRYCIVFILPIILFSCLFIMNKIVEGVSASTELDAKSRCGYIYLPAIGKDPINYLVEYIEREPNDFSGQANGIYLNTEYTGYPDRYDTYVFELPEATVITVEVKHHDTISGQLTLYDGKQVLQGFSHTPPDHEVITNGLPGRYYLFVSTITTTNTYTPTTPYTLKVSTQPLPTPSPVPKTYTAVFDGNKIFADRSLEEARTNTVTINIPPGTYKITLHSSDDHNNSQVQDKEQWYLEFYNYTGEMITKTFPTKDLDDDKNCQFDIVHGVNNSLEISEEVFYVRGMHAAYKDTTPESLRPERAIIEEILP